MNYYIITGASKGLGEAIAKNLIAENNSLFCISRKRNDDLIHEARSKKSFIEYFEYDLGLSEGIDILVERIFKMVDTSKIETICLINNSGILDPIKPLEKCSNSEIVNNISVNAIAPMILCSHFIRFTDELDCRKVIINISSGAGSNPYHGWSCYCSSKAAVDMLTKCIEVEQASKRNPVKTISFSPGIMDTDMQYKIRQTDVSDFEQVERFKKFKEEGKLKNPDLVAKRVIDLI